MKRKIIVTPQSEKILETMGMQIKLARLRRNLPASLIAERANISRQTLVEIEKGNPSVSIGYYVNVLHALNNMDVDFLLIAKDDKTGRMIQDLNLKVRKRYRKS